MPIAPRRRFLQSRGTTIHLLPALPKVWPTGSLRGVCVRGSIRLDLAWRDGKLERAIASADRDKVMVLVYAAEARYQSSEESR